MPSWMRWAGGLCLAVGYSFLFYFFFVSPTGFRWRAIYGDPDYPEGYTIYGIDVSRYQGTINWNRLRNALIFFGLCSTSSTGGKSPGCR